MSPGDIVEFSDGQRCEVLLVNSCRARVRALGREHKSGLGYNPKTGQRDKEFSFLAQPKEFDICPTAQIKTVGHNPNIKSPEQIRLFGLLIPKDT